MLAKLSELTEGTLAALNVKSAGVDAGVLTLTLVRPGGTVNTPVEVGTLEVNLSTGEIEGSLDDVEDDDVADTLALAVEAGDVVEEPNLGLLVVSGVSTDGLRLDVLGASVATSNIRKVGHVDMGELDL